MSKMMGDYKMPNIDVESMMAAQRKNIEAIASSNQKAFENMQAYMRRQAELARQSFEATTSLVQAVMSAPTPEEKVAKQVEATKSAIEGCVSSLKELSEILSQNNVQTMQLVSNAVCEGMDGLQNIMKNKASS
jgi:phasin family protein